MKIKHVTMALVAAALAAAGGAGLYVAGKNAGARVAPGAAAGERKPLYWHDPMVPTQKFDKPGKSPFMDMQLVPVYADGGGDDGAVKVTVSPRMQQSLGVRTAPATRARLPSGLSAVGSVAYNERDLVLVQARSNGFVERLHVRASFDTVSKGQPLLDLYVPEWVAAQEEFLSARRIASAGIDGLVDAARQRMRLAGMGEEQIRLVESTGKVQLRTTLKAPVGGVIAELSVREGMTVMAGATLFRINGLGTVWLNAEVPESAAAAVQPGAAVEARTPALPGMVFKGKVNALLPDVNASTRTLKARVELANPGAKLVPGMFATLDFAAAPGSEIVLVPSEAVIQTGTRSVVMVDEGGGKFAAVDVETGRESAGQTEIRKGLAPGQNVVVSGQFLIDSEASLKGTAMRMSAPAGAPDAGAAGPLHHASGSIEQIDKDEVMISHGPVPTLQWGPMTMGFKPPLAGMPDSVHAGDRVSFDFVKEADGSFRIARIGAAADATPAKAAGASK